MKGAKLTNIGGHTLSGDGMTVNGGIFLNDGFTSSGEIRFPGANIDGQFAMNGATLANPLGRTLNADGATVRGDVLLNDKFSSDGEIGFFGATLSGTLLMTGAALTNSCGKTLSANCAQITGGVFLDREFSSNGEIHILGATIGGQLSMRGAKLTTGNRNTLAADGATIGGGVFLDRKFTSNGEIRLLGATISDQFSLNGATLTTTTGTTLNADRITITGRADFNEGFTSNGEIRLPNAKIDGQLAMRGAKLHSDSGNTLNIAGATITGKVLLDGGFRSCGQIRLTAATIGGDLEMDGVLTHVRETINADQATVIGNVLIHREFETKGSLSFRQSKMLGLQLKTKSKVELLAVGANLGLLRDELSSWAPASSLSGAQYSTDPIAISPTDVASRIEWLETITFSRSNWKQLEKIYREQGHPKAADDVAIGMLVKQRSLNKGCSRIINPFDWLFEKFAGYGYRPLRSVVSLAVLIVIVFASLAWPAGRAAMTASAAFGPTYVAGGPKTEAFELRTIEIDDRCGDGTVRCFNAFLYSFDLVVPFVDLGQVDTWHPDAHRRYSWMTDQKLHIGSIMSWLLPIATLLGWIFSTFGLTGITRLGNRPY
jgi:hypothetical protein